MFQSIDPSWQPLTDAINPVIRKNIEKQYAEATSRTTVYPPIEDIFRFTIATPLDKVRVIILGQDPYHGFNQAHGLCFSVKDGNPLPPSVRNMFKNQMKYGIIDEIPTSGNLERWATQGVLLLNASLTVEEGNPNSHKGMWAEFTNKLITSLSAQKEGLIFVIFGGDAYDKLGYVTNRDKHFYSISSHPSPNGANSALKRDGKEYPCFTNCNHFGKVNEIIRENGLGAEIVW
jgi:uracil-DNA glycosylase